MKKKDRSYQNLQLPSEIGWNNPTPNRTINSNMKPDRTIQKQQKLFWTGQNRLEQRRQLWKAIINFQKASKSGRPILNWTEPSRLGHNHQAAYKSRKNWNKNPHVRPKCTTTVENKSREPNTVENSEEPYLIRKYHRKRGTTILNWLEPSITGHNHQAASKWS